MKRLVKQSSKGLIFSIAAASLLASCAPKVKLSEYQKLPKDKEIANHKIPKYIINHEKPKVAVLPPTSQNNLVKRCSLDKSVQENMITTLSKVGGLQLTERGQLKSIMNELNFEQSMGGEIDINKLKSLASGIDYAFVGSITSAGVNASFSEARRWYDKKGRSHYMPPSCNKQGKVVITYRLISFPSGIVVKSFTLEGQKTTSTEVRYSSECRVDNPCGLLSEAVYRAVDNGLEDFQEAFPSYGYVYKLMTHKEDKNKRIAFITLGKSDGIKAGDKVDIIEFKEDVDPVTGKKIQEKVPIAECTVIEQGLEDNRSICIIDEDNESKVKLKDVVKSKVNKSFFRALQKGARAIF